MLQSVLCYAAYCVAECVVLQRVSYYMTCCIIVCIVLQSVVLLSVLCYTACSGTCRVIARDMLQSVSCCSSTGCFSYTLYFFRQCIMLFHFCHQDFFFVLTQLLVMFFGLQF